MPSSLLRRHRTLLLVTLIGLISVLNSVFVIHEYQQTYRQNVTKVKAVETPVVSRQILQLKKSSTETKSGSVLAKHVRQQCSTKDRPKRAAVVNVFSYYHTPGDKIQLCGIWKIGTTFMKRLFMLKNQKKYKTVHNLYEIPYDVTYIAPGKSRIRLNVSSDADRFLFVRDPYARLYSGYVDKVLAPNPIYWRYIGVPAISNLRKNATKASQNCGHDLTFKEYVDYVILTMEGKAKYQKKVQKPDPHFEVMHKLCKPCEVDYTFIGKMETFPDDSRELIRKLGLNKTEELLKENGAELAVDDAIRDTVHQPFAKEFKKGFEGCMDRRTRLQRAWLKLQARGLIGRQELGLSFENSVKMTNEEFLKMARDARAKSTSKERKDIKNDYLNAMYDTITKETLEKLREVYAEDFKLFNYDDRPDWLFSRPRKES